MKEWTIEELIKEGYEIKNMEIEDVELVYSPEDRDCLSLKIFLKGASSCVVFGGKTLGWKNFDTGDFSSIPIMAEYIMRIMDVVECERFSDMNGKYIRIATKGWGSEMHIIGNIIKNKWFDQESFFCDYY